MSEIVMRSISSAARSAASLGYSGPTSALATAARRACIQPELLGVAREFMVSGSNFKMAAIKGLRRQATMPREKASTARSPGVGSARTSARMLKKKSNTSASVTACTFYG
jgi:hypothetical protein